jgi:multidrug efflux pump subunit AcrA (membrane-fusion protein)
MVRGKWLLFVGVVLISAAGAGAVMWMRRQAPPPQAKSSPQLQLPKGAEISLTGKIQAVQLAHIDALLDGVLEEFSVQVGDEVFEGQILGRIANAALRENEKESLLDTERMLARISALEAELTAARLEDSRLTADLARARSESVRAERAYRRQEMLRREGATPRLTFEKAEKDYAAADDEQERAQAMSAAAQDRIQRILKEIDLNRKTLAELEAAHDSAKSELAAADLLAPVDGIVVGIKKAAGDEVQKGMTGIIDIATDLGQLELVVDVPQDHSRRLAPGQPALIVMAELPGGGLPATIKTVEKERIVVEFSSPSPLIRPSMTAVARFKLN